MLYCDVRCSLSNNGLSLFGSWGMAKMETRTELETMLVNSPTRSQDDSMRLAGTNRWRSYDVPLSKVNAPNVKLR